METETDGLVTINEAAKFLHTGRKRIYQLADEGRLELLKLGHSSRISMASLRRLIAELPRRGPAER